MLSRRTFMVAGAAAGGGLAVGFWLWRKRRLARRAPRPDAYIRVEPNDRIVLVVDEAEMGQGVTTALPMIMAEELDADWSQVSYELAPVDAGKYGRQNTWSSTSVREGFYKLRRAGAAAREMLVAAAAEKWSVPASECTTAKSVIRHEPSGRSASYGELATTAVWMPVPQNPRLKDPAEFTLIGTAVPRLDLPAKIDGSAEFGIDVKVDGMLVAQVERPPVFGARVGSVDASAAEATAGVRKIAEIPGGVVVIAETFWAAQQGRQALSVSWDEGEGKALSSEGIEATLVEALAGKADIFRDDGDAAAALASAATRVEAVYHAPYLAHAAMEPLNCTAHVRADECEIWVPTQSPMGVRRVAAEALGIAQERVTVHSTLIGGGFGRRSAHDYVIDAVHASKAAGAPVKVIWTREDDIRGGQYRPAAVSRMSAGLDGDGRPVAWQHEFVQADYDPDADGAAELPYAIPNLRVTGAAVSTPVTTRAWRSVGHSLNAWFVECFMDELAVAANKDPVELRLSLLGDHPRHRKVIELAAEKAGWGKPVPEGHALGVAAHACFGSYIAQVVEVSLDPSGPSPVKVHRVVCALDCGQVINPDTVRGQIEGGIAFGLSAALYGRMNIEAGRTRESNFHDYRILRLPEMPAIESVLVPSHADPGGVGEPPTTPIAPAVCNAVRALRGEPVRRLPISV
ncbi:molybdopterin cofactor-binding domain-containing protein [Haliangium sp.]|uniref:xanthine dehydrogenase family protein molybdopterin-binding subunit n=1 Tax=Haliangium sp. TaxID=2663208 RepID=UPI003D135944